MEEMENENVVARKGDLLILMDSKPWIVDEEISLLACFWSLGRVTGVTAKGKVSAYRTFGTHYVRREMPASAEVIPASNIDVPAIESDMTARVLKQWDANEFKAPEHAYEYVKTFMPEN